MLILIRLRARTLWDVQGPLSAGGGFADSFYQPVILGWRMKRADIRAIYGFLAPTGRFEAGTNNNVGSGYWTSVLSSGQTIYLAENRSTALSTFEMCEFHGNHKGTEVHPGQTFNLDYSVTQAFLLNPKLRLQVGLAGYGQWQTTDKHGPTITPEQASAHYKVNGLGFAANAISPGRKASIGIKYFHEFECKSTLPGIHTEDFRCDYVLDGSNSEPEQGLRIEWTGKKGRPC